MKRLFLPFLLLTVLASSAQKVSSKIALQKGQKIEVVTNMNATTEMMMGASSNSSVSTELYEVKDATNGTATLERSMKKLKMNLSVMGQEKSIDSDNPEDLKGMLGEPIKELLNAKNEFTIDGGGKIVSVKGADKKKKSDNGMMGMFMQQMNLGAGIPVEGKPSFFKVLPDYEVGKGDTWSDTIAVEGNVMNTSYKVKDITESEIIVDYISDGRIDTKQDMMGMSVVVKGNVKTNGAITLDRATGLLKQKTVTNITETASNLNGQEMNINSKSTSVITVKSL
ncbi:MAG TPA: DUF6263 family protein [Flavisolibacter sp.]|jgi:hypothetical protein